MPFRGSIVHSTGKFMSYRERRVVKCTMNILINVLRLNVFPWYIKYNSTGEDHKHILETQEHSWPFFEIRNASNKLSFS